MDYKLKVSVIYLISYLHLQNVKQSYILAIKGQIKVYTGEETFLHRRYASVY